MKFLMKPHQFSRTMQAWIMTSEQWTGMFTNPPVIADKSRAPLAIYGTLTLAPELDAESGLPRCTGANVESLYALQLDYDSGMSIDKFRERYAQYRWSLYTSYSHGYKGDGDRFRVVMPLASPLPCAVLRSQRVRKNLTEWHFPGADPTFSIAGHWQILPCIREAGAPYVHLQNAGDAFGGEEYWAEYVQWAAEEDAAYARKREAARARAKTVDKTALVVRLEEELADLPVGSGVRHESVKRLLARYVHRGLGEELFSISCPWPDWEKEWTALVAWFVRRAE